jgi:hypothetical protein
MQSCSVTALWATGTHFAYNFIHCQQPIAIAFLKGLVHEIDFKNDKNRIPQNFFIVHVIYSPV